MSVKNITLDDFRSELSTESKYIVELGRLFDICGASPIRFHYEADCVDIVDIYPEAICFKSGSSYINISQIESIVRFDADDGKISYKFVCGLLDSLKTTIYVTKM